MYIVVFFNVVETCFDLRAENKLGCDEQFTVLRGGGRAGRGGGRI